MNKKKLLKKLIKVLQEDAAQLRQERDLADWNDHEKKKEEKQKEQESSSRMFQLFSSLLPVILPIISPGLFGNRAPLCGCSGSAQPGEISPEDLQDIVDSAKRAFAVTES